MEVVYDPARVSYSYEDLLAVFWRVHDPTTPNRQGPDVGSQCRSALFTHSPSTGPAQLEVEVPGCALDVGRHRAMHAVVESMLERLARSGVLAREGTRVA